MLTVNGWIADCGHWGSNRWAKELMYRIKLFEAAHALKTKGRIEIQPLFIQYPMKNRNEDKSPAAPKYP